jgi:molecular chaperone IbpA
MRHFDPAPLYRNTVGFDRLFSVFDQLVSIASTPLNPPYNIERTGENAYRISVAVAGFTDQDLSIEVKENTLSIRGEEKSTAEGRSDVLYQGIAARSFERRFQLADGVQVTSASLENGLLHLDLVREIPEAKKPRQIQIGSSRRLRPLRRKPSRLRKRTALTSSQAPWFGALFCSVPPCSSDELTGAVFPAQQPATPGRLAWPSQPNPD